MPKHLADTGYVDKHGKPIREGDIYALTGFYNQEVKWVEHETNLFFRSGWEFLANPKRLEVIGNVRDNPELLQYVRPDDSDQTAA